MESAAPVQSSPSDAFHSAQSRRVLQVLIVEDSPNDAELMAYELQKYGLAFTWTRVDREADFLARLAQGVDLILADYSVPQFGAVRALEILQERALSIPLVVVSGTIGEEAAASIVKCGATDYVLKTQLALLGGRAARALQGLRKIAYFSMEIALESRMHTYSGGLGILAGDTIRSAADLQVPMVAVSLIHRMGYFRQQLDAHGSQSENPAEWPVEDLLEKLPFSVSVRLETRSVQLNIWKYEVRGVSGYVVPVYLLDSNVPGNSEWDRNLTNELYGGDWYYRICQEIILGVGGVEALRRLGYYRIDRYHMNEGHASLLTIALLQDQARRAGREQVSISDIAAVRHKCIFTTHTPVPAGHDQFPLQALSRLLWCRDDPLQSFSSETALRVFGKRTPGKGNHASREMDPTVNLTYLALNLSRYINGVAKKHGEISQTMFGGYQVDAITNGVHVRTWACPSIQALFDRYIPDWRQDNFSLRYAASIPSGEIWDAHRAAKSELIAFINQREHDRMSEGIFTIGFARRATAYKRLDLLFTDLDRLRKVSRSFGKMQVVFSGKAHPHDEDGKLAIKKIFDVKERLEGDVIISFIENYDMDIAKKIVAGVDLWLNTPRPPMEASGTSGMKAAINGVPSLSILDGWWLEGHIEGITGWSIVEEKNNQNDDETSRSAACLYRKLEEDIIPLFYERPDQFARIMQYAIALNGSFFNTQRMLQQYVLRAYFP